MKHSLVVQDFNIIYDRLSRNGMGEKFFNEDCHKMAESCLEKIAIKEGRHQFFFEIPLLGKPRFDFVAAFKSSFGTRENFIHKDPYNATEFLEWCAKKYPQMNSLFEFDLSAGRTNPNIYLMPKKPGNIEYASDFLNIIDKSEHTNSVKKTIENCSKTWQPYYCSYFNSRDAETHRLSFFIDNSDGRYSESYLLIDELRKVGFNHFNDSMIDEIISIMPFSDCHELMLDQYPDGSFGPILGLCPAFINIETNYKLGKHLYNLKVVDERFKYVCNAFFIEKKSIIYDGTLMERTCGARFFAFKVAWNNGNIIPAKCYIKARTLS